MSELKPAEKGYIEALAKENSKKEYKGFMFEDAINDFTSGYTLALEHNNVPELIEAAKEMLTIGGFDSMSKLLDAVTKAEQNKLNK